MRLKMFSSALILTLILTSVSPALAQQSVPTNDWNSLKNYLNREVAVKIANQNVVYGVLREETNGEIRLLVARQNYQNEIPLNRSEVEKVWLAKLKFGRNTVKGAGVGAGVGAGIGLGIALSTLNKKDNDGLAGALVPILAIYGAGIGGVTGFFIRKKHKKEKLIYQN